MTNETTSTTATSTDLEALRASKIKENEIDMGKARAKAIEMTDDLVAYLKENRGHLAGFAFVAVPYDDGACVSPKEVCASDGMSQIHATNSLYRHAIAHHLQRLINQRNNPLAGLLG